MNEELRPLRYPGVGEVTQSLPSTDFRRDVGLWKQPPLGVGEGFSADSQWNSNHQTKESVMKTNRKLSLFSAAALLLAVGLAGCASGPPEHSQQLHQQIESASTASEHGALVAYYVREASAARANAVEHRARALKYPANTGPRGSPSLRAHCNSIANNLADIATAYDGLAAEHRALAGQAKP